MVPEVHDRSSTWGKVGSRIGAKSQCNVFVSLNRFPAGISTPSDGNWEPTEPSAAFVRNGAKYPLDNAKCHAHGIGVVIKCDVQTPTSFELVAERL